MPQGLAVLLDREFPDEDKPAAGEAKSQMARSWRVHLHEAGESRVARLESPANGD